MYHLQIDHLQIDHVQIYHLHIDRLHTDHVQIDNLQLKYLQIDHLQTDQLDPNLPSRYTVQDLYTTIQIQPQEMCSKSSSVDSDRPLL